MVCRRCGDTLSRDEVDQFEGYCFLCYDVVLDERAVEAL